MIEMKSGRGRNTAPGGFALYIGPNQQVEHIHLSQTMIIKSKAPHLLVCPYSLAQSFAILFNY